MLVDRFATFSESDRAAALHTLTSRTSWAHVLLDAVADGQIDQRNLSEYYVRQLVNLNSETINKWLARQWGKVARSSAEKLEHITRLEKAYTQAPLWAYSAPEGKKHYQKLCASCHSAANERTDIGPQLAGSGAKGIRYFVENIVDPNAVIGADYLTWVILTKDGRVVTGLIQQSTDTAVTVQTPTEKMSYRARKSTR